MLEKIRHGRTDFVYDYLAQGNAASSSDENDTSLLQWCAYYGDVSAMRFLLSQGAQLRELGENLDLTGAAFHGHWQLCQFLLEQGANVNWADEDTGETALHAALCKANRPAFDHVISLLLAAGADPNRKTHANAATGCFMRDCRTRAETPLHRAAAFATERSIDLLLASGADKTCKDCHGDSPLAWASLHLRPPSILRRLCYGDYAIHPDNRSTYDHGRGWHQLDQPGEPQLD